MNLRPWSKEMCSRTKSYPMLKGRGVKRETGVEVRLIFHRAALISIRLFAIQGYNIARVLARPREHTTIAICPSKL